MHDSVRGGDGAFTGFGSRPATKGFSYDPGVPLSFGSLCPFVAIKSEGLLLFNPVRVVVSHPSIPVG
jgi:hypothetical protein